MSWQDSWEVVKPVEGGAQGDCFQVKKKTGDGSVCFLKQLKEGGSKERRSRFYLETMIHRSYQIENTSEIIESNVEEHQNKDINLYYIAKYVNGLRLDKYVQGKILSEEDVKDIFKQLLVILSKCHSVDVVHRDIKPENIIICEGVVHLVDFGIASSSLRSSDTKTGQEIGNRFLRLPEFSSGSTNKRDIRSDITLACGVTLYLFSKVYPRTLLDSEGLLPHQTRTSIELLDILEYKVIWNAIFDRAFMSNLSNRWTCCEDILELLDRMNGKNEEEIESLKAQIDSHAKRFSEQSLNQLASDLSIMFNTIYPIVNKSCHSNSGGFNIQESSWVYNRGDNIRRSEIRFHELGDNKKFFSVILSCELLGEQIVSYLHINNKKIEIARSGSNIAQPYTISNQENIERVILSEFVQYIKSA